MSSATQRNRPADHPARTSGAIIGILVFLLGVALLGYVFLQARGLFEQPPPPLPQAVPAGSPEAATAPAPTMVLGQNLAYFLQRLLVLFLMCVAGSLIAGQGVNLFFKTLAAAPPPPSDPPTTGGGASSSGASVPAPASTP
jgi:hypothetical protein